MSLPYCHVKWNGGEYVIKLLRVEFQDKRPIAGRSWILTGILTENPGRGAGVEKVWRKMGVWQRWSGSTLFFFAECICCPDLAWIRESIGIRRIPKNPKESWRNNRRSSKIPENRQETPENPGKLSKILKNSKESKRIPNDSKESLSILNNPWETNGNNQESQRIAWKLERIPGNDLRSWRISKSSKESPK